MTDRDEIARLTRERDVERRLATETLEDKHKAEAALAEARAFLRSTIGVLTQRSEERDKARAEVERQKMFWESIRDARVDAAEQERDAARAEIARLTRELAEANACCSERMTIISNVSGALADSGMRIGDAHGFANEVRALGKALAEARAEVERLRGAAVALVEALEWQDQANTYVLNRQYTYAALKAALAGGKT